MTKPRYSDTIKRVVDKFDPKGANRYFLFGSSVRNEKFRDIDLGVVGNGSSRRDLSQLRDNFYDSNIPYKVDVVDVDAADEDFREYVLKREPVVWIR